MISRSELLSVARWLVSAAAAPIAGLTLLLWADASFAQTFIQAGPGPRFGPFYASQSSDAGSNGTEAGAVQAILPNPALGAGTIFVGSPNGGIWVTSNNGSTWTPLTDKQASLSIATLGLDPTDKTGKTIIAGIGITDNGEYSYFNQPAPVGRGGAQTGILYTTNGGATWSALGGATLAGQSVIGVEARGSTMLAATFEVQNATGPTAGYGLYRSTNGGTTFSLVSGSNGLPVGAVTSLIADPTNQSRFYAAVRNSASNGATAVYVSNDTGATWSSVFTGANSNGQINNSRQTTITLAAGPDGSVAVAISNLSAAKPRLSGVFLSGNDGATWNQLTAAPNGVAGGQTPVNLHIAIDPNNPNIVYLSGDAYQTCNNSPPTSLCSLQAFRLNYNSSSNTSTATSLTNEGTLAQNWLNASTAHADSRALAFDSSGNLILSSDGGIYLRNNPQGNGSWQGLNGNLSVFEPYQVAYDANSKLVAIATQDNGISLQSAPGNPLFNAINLGDGTNIAINDKTLPGLSAVYSTNQNLNFLSRMIVNAQGQVVSPFPDQVNNPGGIVVTCNGGQYCAGVVGATNSFSAPLVLNRIDPTLIAIGGATDVFVTSDPLTGNNGIDATTIDLSLTKLGTTPGVTVMSYGTQDNKQALAVGASVNGVFSGGAGQVWLGTTGATNSLTQLTTMPEIRPPPSCSIRAPSRVCLSPTASTFGTARMRTRPGRLRR